MIIFYYLNKDVLNPTFNNRFIVMTDVEDQYYRMDENIFTIFS